MFDQNWLENISFHQLPELWNYYLFVSDPPEDFRSPLWKRIQALLHSDAYPDCRTLPISARGMPAVPPVSHVLVSWMIEGYNVWASDYLELYWADLEPRIAQEADHHPVATTVTLHRMLQLWNTLAHDLHQPWMAQADLYPLEAQKATAMDARELWLQVKLHLKRLYHNFALDSHADFWWQQTGCHLPALVQSVIDQQLTLMLMQWMPSVTFVPLMEAWPMRLDARPLAMRPEALAYAKQRGKATPPRTSPASPHSVDTPPLDAWSMPAL
jgi:hypothetical protein